MIAKRQMKRETPALIRSVMESDGSFTHEDIQRVMVFVKTRETDQVDLIRFRDAYRELGVCKATLWSWCKDPAWQAVGLKRIRRSRRQVFLPRRVVEAIKNGEIEPRRAM